MVAAGRFLDDLREHLVSCEVDRLRVFLHGSLAFTGKGHGSDRAVVLGLMGESPESLDPETADGLMKQTGTHKSVAVKGIGEIAFDPAEDIVFDFEQALPDLSGGVFRCAPGMAHGAQAPFTGLWWSGGDSGVLVF